jgi:hypothetical protein
MRMFVRRRPMFVKPFLKTALGNLSEAEYQKAKRDAGL